jgi:hypothetical protein
LFAIVFAMGGGADAGSSGCRGFGLVGLALGRFDATAEPLLSPPARSLPKSA